jgi:hypothetical protein
MPLSKFDDLELPASADFHVHLRDGTLMKAVVPTVRQGGVNTVYVSAVNSVITISTCWGPAGLRAFRICTPFLVDCEAHGRSIYQRSCGS